MNASLRSLKIKTVHSSRRRAIGPFRFGLLACLSIAGYGAWAQTADSGEAAAEEPEPYVRLLRNERGIATSLQTEIAGFEGVAADDQPLRVDLIGALHIADEAYYAELNELFTTYDSLLYEIVAPQGTRVPRGGPQQGGVLSGVQSGMGGMLGLSFQLEQIDYSPENFVHADLSPEEMSQSMNDNGESLLQYFFKFLAVSMTEEAQADARAQNAGLLFALFSDNPQRVLRYQFAQSVTQMDIITTVLDGENGSTLITERNKRVIEVLHQRIAAGDRHIGIFYGAGHMEDLAERLEDELSLAPADSVWLDAWDLR